MRLKIPPLLRAQSIAPGMATVLRYGVAVLSIILALIPAFLLSNLVESRLVVFSVAIMVSAWYGGWKPGLVATSFALTVSAYFLLAGAKTQSDYRTAILHLTLFVFVAALICSFNAALRSAQEALRRSEINFRSLVTHAPYGICRCNSAGILLDANPSMVRMLGFSSVADLAGQNLANLYPDSQQWFAVADHLRSQQEFNGMSAEWTRKDRATINVRLSGRTIAEEHRPVYFELFAEDVTVQRALEQQLRQSQKMEAVGRLAGGIAHDFNNLLMVISGYCEFLLERVGDNQDLRGPAQEIANAASRATSLTRQLLAFSRKQVLAPKVLDLNGVVTENLKMLNRVIGEDITLVMEPATALGAVKADPGQIEQVIMNLAVNARDAMPKGGQLTLVTSNTTIDEEYARFHSPIAPGEYVVLSMSDTGSGMDVDTQTRIFEPFFTTKGPKGTGLGLSTVYGIIKQSGGYILVSSEPGKGTTFKIYLPRVTSTGETIDVQTQDAVPPVEEGHETILVVEDERNLRRLARQFLEKQGYKVLEAADGAAAITISSSFVGPIHLLLTDVIMPGMNGRELAQRLTSLRPQTRVLFMSGYTENVIGHDGTLDAGITLLPKPFSLPALKAKVREVLSAQTPTKPAVSAQAASITHAPAKTKLSPFRAQRFDITLPLKYRPVGENDWREGTTENISRSGLLFQAEEVLAPNVQLEINLVLPPEIAGLAAAEVVCRGEIVRNAAEARQGIGPALAARILQYHFQHGSPMHQA